MDAEASAANKAADVNAADKDSKQCYNDCGHKAAGVFYLILSETKTKLIDLCDSCLDNETRRQENLIVTEQAIAEDRL